MAVALVCNVLSIVEIGAVICCLDWQDTHSKINSKYMCFMVCDI